VSDIDVIHEFVRITGSRMRQSVDQFVKSQTSGTRVKIAVEVGGVLRLF
jgi:hypothetical protein